MKHRKDRADKKKGKIFSRIMKEVISAVKQGGSDPKANSKLKTAIQKAKDANIPSENLDRNIKKAASSDQSDYTEMTYELYGFGGVGLIVDIMTDNKNRISSEIRIATNKCGGTIATPGAVAYNFDRKGIIRVAKSSMDEDALFMLVSELGADDMMIEDDAYVVITPIEPFAIVKEAVFQAGGVCEEATLGMVPKSYVEVTDEIADQNIALIEWLENLDDVDAVYHNMKV
jgi:YebC/PmpR family DNA-binding regulatory protein